MLASSAQASKASDSESTSVLSQSKKRVVICGWVGRYLCCGEGVVREVGSGESGGGGGGIGIEFETRKEGEDEPLASC